MLWRRHPLSVLPSKKLILEKIRWSGIQAKKTTTKKTTKNARDVLVEREANPTENMFDSTSCYAIFWSEPVGIISYERTDI